MRNRSPSRGAEPSTKSATTKTAAVILAASVVLITAMFWTGCATAPPAGLNDARWAYRLARANPSTGLVPVEMRQAREALDSAEASYLNNGATEETSALAEIALRKSETADGLSYMAFNQAVSHKKHAERLAKIAEIANRTGRDPTTRPPDRSSTEDVTYVNDQYFWWTAIYY